MAACIARTLLTMIEALRLEVLPSSARAIERAEAFRFSIFDEAADSERRRIEAKGAISDPISVSKRAISAVASVTSARVSSESGISSIPAIGSSTAAS